MPLLNFGLLCRKLRAVMVPNSFFFFLTFEQLCQGVELNLKHVD